jgi:uncharacterized membrane protein YoaK (UPF0700 family)
MFTLVILAFCIGAFVGAVLASEEKQPRDSRGRFKK